MKELDVDLSKIIQNEKSNLLLYDVLIGDHENLPVQCLTMSVLNSLHSMRPLFTVAYALHCNVKNVTFHSRSFWINQRQDLL